MCALCKCDIKKYWCQRVLIHSSLSSKMMTRDRFCSVLGMLHLNNNDNCISSGEPNHEPLFKVRPYVNFLLEKLKMSLIPGENLLVDKWWWSALLHE